jgi:RNA polymerase primary sigma factor
MPTRRRGNRPRRPRRSRAARDRLVAQWSGLVPWCVERWQDHPAVLALGEDAEQAGCLGLLRAAELWDARRGVGFNTYAVKWIEQALRRESYHCHAVRVPDYLAGRKKSAASKCRADADRALACQQFPWRWGGDGPLPGEYEPADRHEGPEEEAARREAADTLDRLLRALPGRWRDLLLRRAGGQTLQQIADAFGVSRERVRQIEGKALARARRQAGVV